jgi:hypothetical protein
MTEQEFKRCLPAALKGSMDDSVREQFNKCLEDPYTRDIMGQNLIGYTSVLQQGKFKLSSYISAVRYCTYKSMGDTNIMAYKKTFPERFTEFEDKDLPMNQINSYVTAYNKSKLVTLVYQALAIPTSILNQDVFQEAINVQRSLMLDPKVSPMVRCQSAKALMDCLKPEEVKQMELSVSVKESDTVEELRKTTNELAKAQLKALQNGADLTALLNAEIVEVKSDAE